MLRKFTELKCRLMPYLYSQAMVAIDNGWPTSVRAMALEFPEDRTAWSCDTQFMLGSDLLVAPVFDASGEVEFYLPEGRWTNFWDDSRIVQGPRWVRETHNFETLPLYVREGTILVLGKEGEKRSHYDWAKPEEHEVRSYEPREGSSTVLYDADGKLVATLTAREAQGTWRIDGGDVRVRRLSRAQNY